MSYDIRLKDPVTGETAEVPGHLMIGGTYKADYHLEARTFTPALNTEATLNITYNYGRYYYEVYEDRGIREIYRKTGQESIAVLEHMIQSIVEKYKKDGEWITTKREKTLYFGEDGREIEDIIGAILKKILYTKEEIIVDVYEGPDSNYWEATAANALKPVYQLLALAKMRPDCIWDGD